MAVKVKLSKAPGSEVVIPISSANRAGASDADYSGVPGSLTFGAADHWGDSEITMVIRQLIDYSHICYHRAVSLNWFASSVVSQS